MTRMTRKGWRVVLLCIFGAVVAAFAGAAAAAGDSWRSHYDVLGVSRDASESDLRSAYRKRAMEAHPDKGGSEEEFVRLAEAYEVLSDPSKRRMYDVTGGGYHHGGSGRSSSSTGHTREKRKERWYKDDEGRTCDFYGCKSTSEWRKKRREEQKRKGKERWDEASRAAEKRVFGDSPSEEELKHAFEKAQAHYKVFVEEWFSDEKINDVIDEMFDKNVGGEGNFAEEESGGWSLGSMAKRAASNAASWAGKKVAKAAVKNVRGQVKDASSMFDESQSQWMSDMMQQKWPKRQQKTISSDIRKEHARARREQTRTQQKIGIGTKKKRSAQKKRGRDSEL